MHDENMELTFEDLPEEETIIPWKYFQLESGIGERLTPKPETLSRLVAALAFVGYNTFFVAAIIYNRNQEFIWNEGRAHLVTLRTISTFWNWGDTNTQLAPGVTNRRKKRHKNSFRAC